MKIFGYTFSQLWQLFTAWLQTIFPPTVTPVPVVPPPPNTPPAPLTAVDVLASIITAYNKAFVTYYPVGSTTVNAQIHAVTPDQAKTVADLIVTNAKAQGLNVVYLASCIMQESRFDPQCFNHNMSQDHPTITFQRTDWGMCQMSGNYLPSKPGMAGLTEDQMSAKAMDPAWSVPEMATIMAGNLAWATKALADDMVLAADTTKLNTTSLSNAEFLATLAYNRGNTGAVNDVKANATALIQHPYRVATWYDDFKKVFATNNVPTT